MANTLGVLFQDIANAIREKTGNTDTMKPFDFPTAISSIELGGGDSEDATFIYKEGSFTPSSTGDIIVQHNTGVIPDIICVYTAAIVNEAGYIMHYIGYKDELLKALGSDASCYCTGLMGTGNPLNAASSKGFDVLTEDECYFGHVRNVTTASFTIGSTKNSISLVSGVRYNWVTISGIKAGSNGSGISSTQLQSVIESSY